jgi:diacylglycerol kinase (ATP)
MKRLIDAFFNSVRAFRRLAGSEAAFQQELILLLIAIPVGWLVSSSWKCSIPASRQPATR